MVGVELVPSRSEWGREELFYDNTTLLRMLSNIIQVDYYRDTYGELQSEITIKWYY